MRNEKSKELKAFEDQQKTEHYRQGDETNRRVMDTCTTKTFWVGMLLMFFFTSVFHWNLGYPVVSFLGVVPKGTLSGSAEHEELINERLKVARLEGQLAILKKKQLDNAHVKKIVNVTLSEIITSEEFRFLNETDSNKTGELYDLSNAFTNVKSQLQTN
tara:strand:+ start:423 stop:899 length:477 start_codon:yes stop_codon:yes gene_type:complete